MDRRPFAAFPLKYCRGKKVKVYPRDRGFRSKESRLIEAERRSVSSSRTFLPSIVCPENRRYRVTKKKRKKVIRAKVGEECLHEREGVYSANFAK